MIVRSRFLKKAAGPMMVAMAVVGLVSAMTVGLDKAQAADAMTPAAVAVRAQPISSSPVATLSTMAVHTPIEGSTLLPATLILVGIVCRHAYVSVRRASRRVVLDTAERGWDR